MTNTIVDEFCVGNSHANIDHMYSSISARCVCGSTLKRLQNDRWVHGQSGKVMCPAYECACGQRH